MTLYGLMLAMECKSYLEIGASMGGSVIVLADAAPKRVVVVDLFEDKSRRSLETALCMIKADVVCGVEGDSTLARTVERVAEYAPFDVVMIDGGHAYDTVASDFRNYGPMARKAVVFHDIAQPGVKKLWTEIGGGLEISAKGTTMGYGVVFKND